MKYRVNRCQIAYIGAVFFAACGGGKEEATYPPPGGTSGAYNSSGGATTSYSSTGGSMNAPTTLPPSSTDPAVVQEVDVTLSGPVESLIKQLTETQVPPGAKPLGKLILANFRAGGQLTKPLTLMPNKCYSVIAAGVPGISEVNLELMPVVPMLPAIAVDKTTGPLAVLGPRPNCYKQLFISAEVKLVIAVPQGEGLVGVQVYEQ